MTALERAMTKRFEVLEEKQQQPYTFSRVPDYFRNTNEKLYEPRVISFGPYHNGSPHLQAMEKHKWKYLRDFLSHSRTGATLDYCFEKMKVWEEEIRRCYSESISLTSDKFVEMLLLDAGFIIELGFKLFLSRRRCHIESERSRVKFNLGWGLQYLHLDLLLIENQIPYFIIQRLFDLVVGSTDDIESSSPPLTKLIFHLYLMADTFKMPRQFTKLPTEIHHLLHLYHHIFEAVVKPSIKERSQDERIAFTKLEMSGQTGPSAYFIPCATELQEVGVRFKKKRVDRHLLDITFRNGVMEMPHFLIDDTTKPLFTNLIAFEQLSCSPHQRNMTSFCRLMDCLVNTEKDVAILQRSDVIENYLSEEEVARSLNQLGQYSSYGESHYFSHVFKQVNKYRSSSWPKYRARFCNDYFSNPWSFLSLLAAIVLLLLTVLQTFFATYSYFRPPKSS